MIRLPQRLRKLLGTIVLVAFVSVYSLAAMVYGATHFQDASVLAKTLFFAAAGLAWVIPAMGIIWWMQRPDPER